MSQGAWCDQVFKLITPRWSVRLVRFALILEGRGRLQGSEMCEICKRRRPNHTALKHFQRDEIGIGMSSRLPSAPPMPPLTAIQQTLVPKGFRDASCMRCLGMWKHGTVSSQSSSLPPPCARSLPSPTEGRGTAAALSGRSPLSLSQPQTRFEIRHESQTRLSGVK